MPTSAEETVGPGRVEVLCLRNCHRDAGVLSEERYTVANHLILKVLSDWKIRQHWNLHTSVTTPQLGL